MPTVELTYRQLQWMLSMVGDSQEAALRCIEKDRACPRLPGRRMADERLVKRMDGLLKRLVIAQGDEE